MSMDGTWTITIKTPVGPIESTLIVSSAGGALTGTIEGSGNAGNPDHIFDGTVAGDEAEWKVKTTKPMPMTLKFKATVSGDTLSGKVKFGMMGSGALTGVRAA